MIYHPYTALSATPMDMQRTGTKLVHEAEFLDFQVVPVMLTTKKAMLQLLRLHYCNNMGGVANTPPYYVGHDYEHNCDRRVLFFDVQHVRR